MTTIWGDEHYPTKEQSHDDVLDYASYKEKTGYEAEKWLVENQKLPKLALVHSYNIVGAKNITNALRDAGVEVWIVPYAPFAYGEHGIQRR